MAPTPTGTASCMYLPAIANGANGVGKTECSRRDMSGILSQAVSGDIAGFAMRVLQDAQSRDRYGQNRRLRDLGQPKLIFRAFEADLRELVAEGVVGFFKGLSGQLDISRRDLCPCRRPASLGRGRAKRLCSVIRL